MNFKKVEKDSLFLPEYTIFIEYQLTGAGFDERYKIQTKRQMVRGQDAMLAIFGAVEHNFERFLSRLSSQ